MRDAFACSDGIRSRVRDVFDPSQREPVWSGYTCVAGMAYVVPPDIKDVGYKVWVGSRKYFVSVDVGGGRIQWYAFLNIPPGSVNIEKDQTVQWLKNEQYADWAESVHLLLDNSPLDEVEQRVRGIHACMHACMHACLPLDEAEPLGRGNAPRAPRCLTCTMAQTHTPIARRPPPRVLSPPTPPHVPCVHPIYHVHLRTCMASCNTSGHL